MTDRYSSAEQAVVAGVVADPTLVPSVWERLKPEDFGSRVYREAWEAIGDLSRSGKPIDIIVLKSRGVELPLGFLDVVSSVKGSLDAYVDIVLDGAFRRRVYDHAERVQSLAWSNTHDRADIIAALSEFEIEREVRDPKLFSQERAAVSYAETIARRKSGKVGLPWGYEALDTLLQPAVGGDMIVIAARPSVGKTALAENLVDHWGRGAPHPVLFISAEMRLSQLMDRAVSRTTGIPAASILRGRTTEEEDRRVEQALVDRQRDFNIWYDDDGQATTASIRAAAASVHAMFGGLSGIVVDYIQLLKDKNDNQVQKITNISGSLKGIAREFDAPMLALSQLSRAGQYRKDDRPVLSDLRDSGAIEQDADIVLGLYDEYDRLEVIVLKNRQGSIGTVYLDFDKSTVFITDTEDYS